MVIGTLAWGHFSFKIGRLWEQTSRGRPSSQSVHFLHLSLEMVEAILGIRRRNEWRGGSDLVQIPEPEQPAPGGRRGQLHTGRQKVPFASLEEVHYLASCPSSFESVY